MRRKLWVFQLVLQFRADLIDDFDQLAALEESLDEHLSLAHTVDGHDCGCGEFNIFIHTDEPEAAYAVARTVIAATGRMNELRAAYRRLDGEGYVVLWPEGAGEFRVA